MVTATALLLCDFVYEDPTSHNVTVLGIFTAFRPSRFPSPARPFSAYALLVGGPGEAGELLLQCTEEDGELVHFYETVRTQLGSSGKRHVHIRFGEDFRFPRPGRYRFTLAFNGGLIGEQTITLSEAP